MTAETERQRVAVVGPTHPNLGGIAQHTTELARRLEQQGRLDRLIGWRVQAPAVLSPRRGGTDASALRRLPRRTHPLDWKRPQSWARVGHELGGTATTLVLVLSDVLQFPALRTIAAAYRHRRRSEGDDVVLIVHNVLPHARRLGDTLSGRVALRGAGRVVVHTAAQAEEARRLGATGVVTVRLPLHVPVTAPAPARSSAVKGRPSRRLAFIGTIRPYKGVDSLLVALARSRTRPSLTIQGEFWQGHERYADLAARLGLSERVDLIPGYASWEDLSALLRASDALVLPYLSATGSQMPRVAFTHGIPVVATDVADFAEQVNDQRDGLIVPPGDPDALAAAIDRLFSGSEYSRLRSNVKAPLPDREWDDYLDAILGRER